MKKLIIFMIALLLLIGGTVNAQNQNRTPEERAQMQAERLKMQIERIKTTLTLTDEQTTKLTTIMAATAKINDSLRTANQGGDRAAMMEKMKPYSDARDAKIKAILTADQVTVFDEKKAELFSFRRPQAQQ